MNQGSPDDPLPEVPYKIVVLCEACSVRVPQTRGNAAETIELIRQRRVRLILALELIVRVKIRKNA